MIKKLWANCKCGSQEVDVSKDKRLPVLTCRKCHYKVTWSGKKNLLEGF
jgi:hypothetical protein